ncbi:MAG: hypothetical protein QOF48_177 [Verrucomicrobiota bacterium]|jgi:hypothetical protein
MEDWIGLLPRIYTAPVRLFAYRLPSDKLVEAAWIAQARKPEGGIDAFKYFCGVCHGMIRERNAYLARN